VNEQLTASLTSFQRRIWGDQVRWRRPSASDATASLFPSVVDCLAVQLSCVLQTRRTYAQLSVPSAVRFLNICRYHGDDAV